MDGETHSSGNHSGPAPVPVFDRDSNEVGHATYVLVEESDGRVWGALRFVEGVPITMGRRPTRPLFLHAPPPQKREPGSPSHEPGRTFLSGAVALWPRSASGDTMVVEGLLGADDRPPLFASKSHPGSPSIPTPTPSGKPLALTCPFCGTRQEVVSREHGVKERLSCPGCGVEYTANHIVLERDDESPSDD